MCLCVAPDGTILDERTDFVCACDEQCFPKACHVNLQVHHDSGAADA